MEKISVKLDIKDKEFARAFAISMMGTGKVNLVSINDKCDVVISDAEWAHENGSSASADESRAHPADERPYEYEVGAKKGAKKIILVNCREEERIRQDIARIYRYAATSAILAVMNFMLGRKIPHSGGANIKFIPLIAEDGGVGTSTIGVYLAHRIAAGEYGRPLYLNLCPCSTSPREILWGEGEAEDGKAWVRLLVALRRGRRGALGQVVREMEGMSYIAVPHFNRHANAVNRRLMEALLTEMECEGFTHLICDMGNHLEGNRRDLLKQGDRILVVNGGYELERTVGDKGISIISLYSERAYEIRGNGDADARFDYCGGAMHEMDLEFHSGMERIIEIIDGEE